MPRYVALLRAVNVGGRKVTMKELHATAEGLGHTRVATLLASGNLLFNTRATAPSKLETALEAAIQSDFGLFSDVVIRDGAEWENVIAANPFPEKAKEDPTHLVVAAGKAPPDMKLLGAFLDALRARHDKGEKLEVIGRHIFIDYGPSVGQSKLILPKKLGPFTARNWNTVLKIADALSE